MYCLAVLGTIPDAPGDTVELEPARIQSESLEFLVGEVRSIHIPIDHRCLGQYGTHPFLAGQRGGHGVSEGVHAVALGDHAGVEHAPDMPRASERRHDEGGFNRWSQHRLGEASVGVRRRLPQGFASRGSCVVGC